MQQLSINGGAKPEGSISTHALHRSQKSESTIAEIIGFGMQASIYACLIETDSEAVEMLQSPVRELSINTLRQFSYISISQVDTEYLKITCVKADYLLAHILFPL